MNQNEQKSFSMNKNNIVNYNTPFSPTWCPGCGNFGIQAALKQALAELNLELHNILMVWGIGCAGNTSNFYNVYGIHGLHGRALPVASAAKLVNPKLTVIAEGGDGDGYGIGLGHFIHASRRNIDITYIVHNNLIYGLTAGQASPTSEKNFKSKSTPCGVIERPINPMALALSSDATFIARGFANDIVHLKNLIMAGIRHRGFALIDILQPCVTFNKQNTNEFFQEKIYKLEEIKDYDIMDKEMAWHYANEWGPKIPIGIFYQEQRLTYADELPQVKGVDLIAPAQTVDVAKTLGEFR